jgi:hypothetical protein
VTTSQTYSLFVDHVTARKRCRSSTIEETQASVQERVK